MRDNKNKSYAAVLLSNEGYLISILKVFVGMDAQKHCVAFIHAQQRDPRNKGCEIHLEETEVELGSSKPPEKKNKIDVGTKVVWSNWVRNKVPKYIGSKQFSMIVAAKTGVVIAKSRQGEDMFLVEWNVENFPFSIENVKDLIDNESLVQNDFDHIMAL